MIESFSDILGDNPLSPGDVAEETKKAVDDICRNNPETVVDIVENWLKENGYDGLCCPGCGCGRWDLAPCGEYMGECNPAYRWDCKKCVKRCDDYRPEGYCFQSTIQEKTKDG